SARPLACRRGSRRSTGNASPRSDGMAGLSARRRSGRDHRKRRERAMPNVSVYFAGVVAVGPARPRVAGPRWSRNGPFYAVFPPSTRRRVTNDAPSTADFIPFHIPALITKVKKTSGRNPDQTNGQLSAWFPFRERLIFNITPNDESVLTYEHTEKTPLPDYDVDLIADFRDFWPAVSIMPPDA